MRLRSSRCVCMLIPLINIWMAESICMKLGVYVKAPKIISTAYFLISPIGNTNITAFQISEAKA
jgi:hypothetical protein